MREIFCLQHLTSDILQHILSSQNLFSLRRINKAVKDRIEKFPSTVIKLSQEGSKAATPDFFASFHEGLVIETHHGWIESSGWYRSYLNAIELGLNLDHTLHLGVDENQLTVFSKNLKAALNCRGCPRRIKNVSLYLRAGVGYLETPFDVLQGLRDSVENVALRLELVHRHSSSLQPITQYLAGLSPCISFIELTVR